MIYVKGSYFTVVEDGDSKIKDSQYLAPLKLGVNTFFLSLEMVFYLSDSQFLSRSPQSVSPFMKLSS